MVQPWRMQVTTSCRMRRPGAWNSTSLVATVATRAAARHGRELRAAGAGRAAGGAASGPDRRDRRRRPPIRRQLGGAGRVRLVGHEHGDQALGVEARRPPSRAGTSPCRRAACRATAGGRAGRRRAGRSGRPGAALPSVRSSRQPTISRTPVAFAASCARTMPARLLRSVIARASMPRHGRLGEQLLARAGAAQEREMRRALELGVAHPNTPCRNQRCEPVPASSPSPSRNSQKRSPASVSTWK